MIDFDIIFQNNNDQDKLKLHKERWMNLGNINNYPPEDLCNCIVDFANDFNFKSVDDIMVAQNPKSNILDSESARMLSNIVATVAQRYGEKNAKDIISKTLNQQQDNQTPDYQSQQRI